MNERIKVIIPTIAGMFIAALTGAIGMYILLVTNIIPL